MMSEHEKRAQAAGCQILHSSHMSEFGQRWSLSCKPWTQATHLAVDLGHQNLAATDLNDHLAAGGLQGVCGARTHQQTRDFTSPRSPRSFPDIDAPMSAGGWWLPSATTRIVLRTSGGGLLPCSLDNHALPGAGGAGNGSTLGGQHGEGMSWAMTTGQTRTSETRGSGTLQRIIS